MESVLRATAIYAVLLVLFRFTGARALGQITTFDFILLLIISEAIQNAMVGAGYSLVNALVLVVTLMTIDVLLSLVKSRVPTVERWLEGVPLVIVDHGRPLLDRLRKSRVDISDVLTAARSRQGLERLEQIKYAVLERSGDISIVPATARSVGSVEAGSSPGMALDGRFSHPRGPGRPRRSNGGRVPTSRHGRGRGGGRRRD